MGTLDVFLSTVQKKPQNPVAFWLMMRVDYLNQYLYNFKQKSKEERNRDV